MLDAHVLRSQNNIYHANVLFSLDVTFSTRLFFPLNTQDFLVSLSEKVLLCLLEIKSRNKEQRERHQALINQFKQYNTLMDFYDFSCTGVSVSFHHATSLDSIR